MLGSQRLRQQPGTVSRRALRILAVIAMVGAVAAPQRGWSESIGSVRTLEAGQVSVESFPGNRLRDLVIGVPGAAASLGEARTAFGPGEKIILNGRWEPGANGPTVDWEWYGPGGDIVYSSQMEVLPEWRNTWNTYRGPRPLAAGNYTVLLLHAGQRLGAIGFKVVREESEIPVRVMAKAFEASKLTTEQATALAKGVRAVAAREKTPDEVAGSLAPGLADRGIAIAVGLYQNNLQKLITLGRGDTLKDSLKSALTSVKSTEGLDTAALTVELSVLHSGMDISTRAGSVRARLSGNAGFSLQVGENRATLLPSVVLRNNIKEPLDLLRQLSIDAGLSEDGYDQDGAELTVFKSQEFVLLPGASEVAEMLNGRAVVTPESLTHDRLMRGVDLAIQWYLTNQQPRGNYMYSFIPARDEYPGDDWCVRVLNSIFVMAEFALARPDRPEIRASVERAADLYAGSLQKNENGLFVHWKEPRADWGLGSTAFLLGSMAMLNRPQDQEKMEQMALAIIGEQDESGRYSTYFLGADRPGDQLFYPGEAMLGLMRYYKLTRDERASESVARAFEFYKEFWSDRKEGPYVPWQIRAYMELHAFEPRPEYAEYAFELMDWMLDEMPPIPLHVGLAKAGALERMFASTGVYTEGLVAAYMFARRVGDEARAARYGRALVGCVRYLLGLQFEATDVYAFPRPEKILGALATKPRDNELRLDFTYHGISAVNTVTQILTPEEWDELRASAF